MFSCVFENSQQFKLHVLNNHVGRMCRKKQFTKHSRFQNLRLLLIAGKSYSVFIHEPSTTHARICTISRSYANALFGLYVSELQSTCCGKFGIVKAIAFYRCKLASCFCKNGLFEHKEAGIFLAFQGFAKVGRFKAV